MLDLDELARDAIAAPIASPTPTRTLVERNRLRRRRQTRLRIAATAAVLLPLAAAGTYLAADTRTQTVDAASGPVIVSGVFGDHLAQGGAVWPERPEPLDNLLQHVNDDILRWSDIDWDLSGMSDTEGGITGNRPDIPGRRIAFQVRQAGDGWQIISLYPWPRLVLSDGNLAGFAGVDLPPDTATVEIYHNDGEQETLTTRTIEPGTDANQMVSLGELVSPEKAGTFLIIGRTGTGQATLVTGLDIGTRDRLTIAIDDLLDVAVPASLPPRLDEAFVDEPNPAVDFDGTAVIRGLGLGLDLYVVPYQDGSGACLYFDDEAQQGTSGGCTDMAYPFNETGYISYQQNRSEADGYTVAVMPDTISISTDIGGSIDLTGHILVIPGNYVDRLIVENGTLRIKP